MTWISDARTMAALWRATAWLRALLAPPRGWLLAFAVASAIVSEGWVVDVPFTALCGARPGGAPLPWLALSEPSAGLLASLVAWPLMLLAMMPPLLAEPLTHLWYSSVSRRRAWAVALFIGAYGLFWMIAGLALVPLGVVIQAATPGAGYVWAVGAIALLQSSSPAAQRSRNRCHQRPRVGAAGRRADLECLRFGWQSGLNCTSLCWPWMLLCLDAGRVHLPLMLAVQIWLIADRAFPPRPPTWQLPPLCGEWRWRSRRFLEVRSKRRAIPT